MTSLTMLLYVKMILCEEIRWDVFRDFCFATTILKFMRVFTIPVWSDNYAYLYVS